MSAHHSKLKTELHEILQVPLEYPGRNVILGSGDQNANRAGAAVTVLFRGTDFENSEVLLILRSEMVLTHKGQVAFPGGSVDPEDQGNTIQTALRECEEEVGLSRERVQVIGELPTFPTLSGNFCVVPVLGWVDHALPVVLSLQASEVSIADWVPVKKLLKSRRYQDATVSSVAVKTPEFDWDGRRMWGLSAWIFDLILSRYDTISS